MRTALLLSLVVISLGCDKKEPPAAEAPKAATSAPSTGGAKSAKPETKPEAPAPSGSVAPKKVVDNTSIHAFAGTIGKDLEVRMYLERKGDDLTGLYVAKDSPVNVPLKGKVKADDKFELTETDDKGKVVGTFDGWFKGGLLKGTYVDAKTKKSQVFVTKKLTGPTEAFTTSYSGALGGKLRIRAKLERKGKTLEGMYRYAKSKDNLLLSGTIDEEGEVVLKETTKAGKETGRMEGYLLSSGLLVGRWYSPDKTKSLSLLLEASDAYPEIVDLGFAKVAPQEEFKELAKNCTSSILFPAVEGGKGKATLNPLLRKEAGGHMEKEACEGASSDMPYVTETTYHVTKTKAPWFGVRFNTYWSTGGAHPSWASTCKVADTESGELFALASKMTPDARKTLTALVNKKLRKEHGVDRLTEAGFFEDDVEVTETTNVCVGERGGLVVEYNPYEVTPWVMGAPTIEIDKGESKGLLPAAVAPIAE